MRLVPPFATARARFILREGIYRRGSIVGLVVAGVYAALNLTERSITANWWQACLLVCLSFVEWTLGAGWLIGVALWSWREHGAHSSIRPRSSRPDDRRR
jgi:hypothetical protein